MLTYIYVCVYIYAFGADGGNEIRLNTNTIPVRGLCCLTWIATVGQVLWLTPIIILLVLICFFKIMRILFVLLLIGSAVLSLTNVRILCLLLHCPSIRCRELASFDAGFSFPS